MFDTHGGWGKGVYEFLERLAVIAAVNGNFAVQDKEIFLIKTKRFLSAEFANANAIGSNLSLSAMLHSHFYFRSKRRNVFLRTLRSNRSAV